MGYQKLQVSRITAMDNKLSDTEDTVNLNDVINSYTRTGGGGGGVINATGATFITDGVKPGDLVVNTTVSTNDATRIISVNSETQITCSIATTSVGQTFDILSQSTEPAVLYIGTSSGQNLKVRTSGGDDITFHNVVQGTFLPVQVKRVYKTGTTASDILALF